MAETWDGRNAYATDANSGVYKELYRLFLSYDHLKVTLMLGVAKKPEMMASVKQAEPNVEASEASIAAAPSAPGPSSSNRPENKTPCPRHSLAR